MKSNLKFGLAGRYRLTACKLDDAGNVISERLLADWFPNEITDIGLNALGGGQVWIYCRVGSGSTPPATTDTQLVAQLGSTSTSTGTVNGNSGAAPWYGYSRRTYRFAAGVATGNVSEVGVGWAATGATLFSRALVRDEEGDPVTVTVLADEVLDVVYEARMYAPYTVDTAFDVVISGVTYSVTGRVALAANWNPNYVMNNGFTGGGWFTPYTGSLGTVTQSPSGTAGGDAGGSLAAYANNSLTRSGNFSWGLDSGNLAGGIKSIRHTVSFAEIYFQFEFSTAIPKNNTKTLTLGFSYTWGRYAP